MTIHLERLEIHDLRGFVGEAIELPRTGLVLLIGPNNSGKSTLLNAAQALLEHERGTLGGGASGAYPHSISGHFGVVVNPELEPTSELAQPSKTARQDAGFVCRLPTATTSRIALSDELTQAIEDSVESIVSGEVEKNAEAIEKARAKAKAPGAAGLQARTSIPKRIDPNSRRSELRAERSEQWQKRIQEVRRTSSFPLHRFDPHRSGSRRVSPIDPPPDALASDGSNLAIFLHTIHTNRGETLRKIRATVEDLVPDAGSLRTNFSSEGIEVGFDDPYTREFRNIKDLGSGAEQVVMMSVAGHVESSGTWLIEEPELHLHPGAQRRLFYQLLEWSRTRLIIASTHSSVFLDPPDDGVHIFRVSRTNGRSRVERASSVHTPILSDLGVRLSDVMSADRCLFVEGLSDISVLDAWFGSGFIRENRISVRSMFGGDSADLFDRLVRFSQSTDTISKSLRFLIDRDERAEAQIQQLKTKGVEALPCREIENLLLDPHAIAKLLISKGISEPDIDVSKIDADISTIAAGHKQWWIAKRSISGLAPILPIDRRLLGVELQRTNGDAYFGCVRDHIALRVDSSKTIAAFEENWDLASQEADRRWDVDFRRLSPGSKVLKAILAKFGRSYDKSTDASALARSIAPNEELSKILRAMFEI